MKRRIKSIVKGLLRTVAMPMARAVARYGPVKRTARALLGTYRASSAAWMAS